MKTVTFCNHTVNVRDVDGVMFVAEDFAKLEAIMTRLYDDRPLSYDQRRDLANAMYGVMGNAINQ